MISIAQLNADLRKIAWRFISFIVLPLGITSSLAGLLFGTGALIQTLLWPDGYTEPYWPNGDPNAPLPPGIFLPAQIGSAGLLLASLVYLGLVFVPMIRSSGNDEISNPWPTWRYLIAIIAATILFWLLGGTALSMYTGLFD